MLAPDFCVQAVTSRLFGEPSLPKHSVAFADVLGLDPLELWLLAGLAVVMLAALGRMAWRKHSLRAEEIDPFLVFPESAVRRPMQPSPLGGLAWAPPAADADDDEPYRPAEARPMAPPVPARPARPAPPLPRPRPSWSAKPSPAPVAVDEASETIRLPTAADGTVQLLPGMLIVTQGPEVGREFRFLRIGSQPVPELTLGRTSGPPYRHIQLPAATVSRQHARIRYEGGIWHIANLSMTNPLRVNGRELPPMQESALADGDRIELGEVELSYRDGRV